MTVGQLKTISAAYLHKDPTDFVRGGVDLVLVALNNARRTAERMNDFLLQTEVCELLVDPTDGGSLEDAYLRGDDEETPVKIKDYKTFYLTSDDGDIPLYHHSKKNIAVWTSERNLAARGRYLTTDFRYPDDSYLRTFRVGPTEVYINGRRVFLNPAQETAKVLAIDAILWMTDYTSDSQTDWMTENCPEYLQYAAICELNYFTATFVPGLDGNLAPPERLKKEALETLIRWDASQISNGRNPRGIR